MELHSLKNSASYDVEVFRDTISGLKLCKAARHIKMKKKILYLPKQNIASLSLIRRLGIFFRTKDVSARHFPCGLASTYNNTVWSAMVYVGSTCIGSALLPRDDGPLFDTVPEALSQENSKMMRAKAPAAEGKRLQNRIKRGVHGTEQNKKWKMMYGRDCLFVLCFFNVTCHSVLWSSATTTAISKSIPADTSEKSAKQALKHGRRRNSIKCKCCRHG